MRVFLAVFLVFSGFSVASASCPGLTQGFSATVVRVLDAETLRLDDGSELRLAGLVTPHQDDAGAAAPVWPAAVAAKAETTALLLGKSITVSFGSERRDRYGRHIGHVSVDEAGAPRSLQAHLLGQGLARVATRAGDRACEAEMLAAERPAREANLGLWADAAYRIRQAGDLDALSARVGSFQIVEGRIADVRRSARGLRLEFAENGKFGLVGLVARDKGHSGGDLTKDQRVRLRGWLEERGGRLTLDLTVIGTLEVLE